jgi:hypothetical protein
LDEGLFGDRLDGFSSGGDWLGLAKFRSGEKGDQQFGKAKEGIDVIQ